MPAPGEPAVRSAVAARPSASRPGPPAPESAGEPATSWARRTPAPCPGVAEAPSSHAQTGALGRCRATSAPTTPLAAGLLLCQGLSALPTRCPRQPPTASQAPLSLEPQARVSRPGEDPLVPPGSPA